MRQASLDLHEQELPNPCCHEIATELSVKAHCQIPKATGNIYTVPHREILHVPQNSGGEIQTGKIYFLPRVYV